MATKASAPNVPNGIREVHFWSGITYLTDDFEEQAGLYELESNIVTQEKWEEQ